MNISIILIHYGVKNMMGTFHVKFIKVDDLILECSGLSIGKYDEKDKEGNLIKARVHIGNKSMIKIFEFDNIEERNALFNKIIRMLKKHDCLLSIL